MSRIRSTYSFCLILAISLVGGLINSTHVAAQAANLQTGIAVSPAFINAQVSSTSKTYVAQITVTNNYDAPLTLDASLQMIDEVGGKLLPTQSLDPIVASAIKMPETTIAINEHASHIISLTFENTDELTAGGHYAALVLTQSADKEKSLSVKSSVVVGIFLVKRGGEVQNLETEVGVLKRPIFSLPQTLQLSFRNTGNVHVTPRAAVLVYNEENLLAKGVTNEDSRLLLPGKKYQEDITIKKIANIWYPAFLTLRIQSRFDGSSKVQEYSQRFLYIPPVFVVGVGCGLASIVLVIKMRRRIKKMLFNRQYFQIKKKIILDPTIVEKEELPLAEISTDGSKEKKTLKKTKPGERKQSKKTSPKKQ